MKAVAEELVRYGTKIAQAKLVAGAGGNISARDGKLIWMKPSGFAMDEMAAGDLCGIEIATGRQVKGPHKPTSEFNMHLGIYRVRPDVMAVFHTHSPWASGVISSHVEMKAMFAEFLNDLGRVMTLPFVMPTTQKLADAVSRAMKDHETLFMVNHGVLAVGVTMKQAFYRCVVVEDAAISMVAAATVGRPKYLTASEIREFRKLDVPKHRVRMMENQ